MQLLGFGAWRNSDVPAPLVARKCGAYSGNPTDQSGGVPVGATVTVIDTQRGTTRTLTTNQAGEYNVPSLLPSTYTVRGEAMGFKRIERLGILLEANQELRVDLLLEPGQQTQTITVTEAIPMVDTTNAELGGTLQSEAIDSLPMNGRNFQNLLQLTPGVMIYLAALRIRRARTGCDPTRISI